MKKKVDPFLLIVTMEECGELIQACSKLYRHGNKKFERRTKVKNDIIKTKNSIEKLFDKNLSRFMVF